MKRKPDSRRSRRKSLNLDAVTAEMAKKRADRKSLVRVTDGLEGRRTMNNRARDKAICIVLLAILFSTSNILFSGSEPLATDDKDYSKEAVPLEKSWCETPKPFEIRIGAPGWLAGISGESGVLGLV